MKRTLIFVGVAALVIGLTWTLGTTASKKPAASGEIPANTVTPPTPVTPPVPDCPIPTGNCFVLGCSPTGSCTTFDLGSNKCKQPDGGFFHCSQGQTVHYTRCQCTSPCGASISQLFCA